MKNRFKTTKQQFSILMLCVALVLPFISAAQITGSFTICVGSTTPLSHAVPGGTWTSASTSIATVGSSSGIVAGVSTGTVDITYTVGATTDVAAVTVNPLPAPISGPGFLCAGTTITLSSASPGGTWSSSVPVVAFVGSSTGIVTGTSSGTTSICYTLSTGCSTCTIVTVNPTPGSLSGPAQVCIGACVTESSLVTGGTWSSSAPGIATIGSSTGTLCGVALGLSTITYTLPTGCFTTKPITVNSLPGSHTVTGGGSYCAGGAGLHIGLSTSSSGIIYELYLGGSPTGTIVAGTGGPLDFGLLTSAGIYTVVATNLTTGCARTMSGSATITINPVPSTISGPSALCIGATMTLSSSPGGTWTSSLPAVATIGSSSGIVTGITTGTTTITYAFSTGCYTTATVNVVGAPCPPVASATTICIGGISNLSDCFSGGTWTSGTASIASVGSLTGVVTGVSAGNVTITYSLGSSCTTTIALTVNPDPATITGPSFVCVGSTMTLSDVTPGGTWSSSSSSTASVSSIGVVTGVATGIATISYTAGGCSVSKTITVDATPAVIGGTSSVCAGSTITLTNAVPGGVWSSSSTAIAGIGSSSGVVSGNAPGTALITYSIGGCIATKFVTVNAIAPITGALSVCIGTTSTLTNAATGGTWSSGTPGVASVGASSGIVTGIVPGTSVITYSMPSGCSATATVTANTTPLPISGTTHICSGTTSALADGTAGGAWTSSNPAIATIGSSSGLVSGIAGGTAVITYSLGGGCTTTVIFTVDPTPSVISGPGSICVGNTTTLSNSLSGGVWSSSIPAIANIGSASGIVSGISSGTVVIAYTVGTLGCAAISALVVNPISPVTGPTAVCVGQTITLNDTTLGGSWSSSNITIAAVGSVTGIVTGIAAGTATISYTLPTGCIATAAVTVDPLPTPILGTASVCIGSSTVLANLTPGGAWTSGNTAIATISPTGVVAGIAAGTVAISYTLGTGCFIATLVTVNSLPAPISGSGNVCVGFTIPLTNAVPGGTWISSAPAVASVDPSSGIVTGLTLGATIISYTLPTGCVATMVVNVISLPAPVTGTMTLCAGGGTTLSSTTSGGNWSSSNPSIATVGVTSGIVSGFAAGNAVISYSIGSGCVVTATVTVNPMPMAITGSANLCIGTTTTLSSATTGGAWTSSNPSIATIGVTSGVVTGISLGSAIITYTLSTGCASSALVSVNPTPAPITGNAAVCIGSSTILFDATPGGTWTSANPPVATITGGGIVFGWSLGTVLISYTMPGSVCPATRVVSVNSFPAAITGPSNICVGINITLSNAVPGGAWSSSNPSIATVNPATGVVSGISAGPATITYSTGSGCDATLAVTVFPVPAPISGSGSVCTGQSIALSSLTTGGSWSSGTPSIGSVDPSGNVTGLTAGTVTISYSNSFGCPATHTVIVQLSPGPILGSTNICLSGTGTLSNSVPGGTWTSSIPSVATIDATTGFVTGFALGSTIVMYQLPSGCLITTTVNVISLPSVFAINGGGNHCSWDTGVHIGLTGSVVGVNYLLYNGTTAIGPFPGTGAPLDFGLYTVPGTYTATATSSGTTCTQIMAGSVIVGITPPVTPVVTMTISPGASVCAGTSVTYTPVPVHGGMSPAFDWSVNGIPVATSTTYTFIPTHGDVVRVDMASNAPCPLPAIVSHSVAMTVTSYESPIVTVFPSPNDTVCKGTMVTLFGIQTWGGSAPAYTWMKNNVNVGSASSYTFAPVDGDRLYCIMASNYPCRNYDIDSSSLLIMTVDTPVQPTVFIAASPGTTILVGQSDTLTAYVYNATNPTFQWYLNGLPVAGATTNTYISNSFTYPVPDSVSVSVTSNGVCPMTVHQWVFVNVITAVNDISGGIDISVVPNPNKGEFIIKGTVGSSSPEAITLDITNMIGQKIHASVITPTSGKINERLMLQNILAPGSYLLTLRSGAASKVFHIVVQQ